MSEFYRQSRLARQSLRNPDGVYLIVEDDQKLSRLLCKVLEKYGKRADTVETVKAAKEYIDENAESIICVVIDIGLPDGSGSEIAAWIGERHPDIPFFMHTADSTRADSAKKDNPHTEIVMKGDIKSFLEILGIEV